MPLQLINQHFQSTKGNSKVWP